MRAEEIARVFDARRTGTGWAAKCPAHDDRHASLSISEASDGKTLLKCHVGCSFEAILAAKQLTAADCFPAKAERSTQAERRITATYPYHDADGKLLYESVRYFPKDFRQRRPDGAGGWVWNLRGVELVLFRLPEVLRDVQRGVSILIVEGEKDALALAERGFSATTSPMGSGKWRAHFSETLRGGNCVVVPDNDEPGRSHAEQVAASLNGVAASVRIVNLPERYNGRPIKDAFDFFAAGATAAELVALIDAAHDWMPNAQPASISPEILPAVPADDASEFEFANALEKQLPPIKTCGKDWFACQEGTWRKINRAVLRPKAQAILPPKIRTARREATLLDHLEGRWQVAPETFAGFYTFDAAGRILVNCANGIVSISADAPPALLPPDPARLYTVATAANFNPAASAPLFERVLAEALPDAEDRELFKLCMGNLLLPDCRYEVALVCYGEAGRGKSTVAEPIAAALGMDLVTRLTMQQICDERSYHLPKLRFAAVNLGTELDTIAIDESQNFKTIVSGEPVEARPIYGEPITMRTACKLWFLANGLPRFKNGSEAELRRTRFIRFNRAPASKDVTLKDKLLAERDGVFNFMLAGLQCLLTLPEIPLGSAESREVHARFKVSNDPLGSFIASRCVFEPAGSVTKDTLRQEFDSFCETHGLPGEFAGWLFKRLYERWPSLSEVHLRRDGTRLRAVAGLRLLPQGNDEA